MPKRQAAPAQAELVEARDENARLASLATDAEGRIAALQRDLAAARADLSAAQADLSSARAELAAAHPEPALSRSPEHSEGEVEGPALSRSPERSEGEVEGPPESEPPAETAQPPEESREEPPPAPPDFRSLSAIDKIKLGLPARTPIKQRRG